jgi:hypothetical protein
MKRFLTICAGVAAVCFSVSAFAAMESGEPAGNGPSAAMTGGPTGTTTGDAGHPCKAIMESCKSAGFTKGGTAGKGIMRDCMKPIMNGQTVAGVTATPDLVAACKTKMAERNQRMGVGTAGGTGGEMTGGPGGPGGTPGAGGPPAQ